ncbi:MAG: glycosyltransferase family 9 protein [Planctomycetes bacterium]|nr:glycosyltransferase family 9 protein [Planctomycetota bacterium]
MKTRTKAMYLVVRTVFLNIFTSLSKTYSWEDLQEVRIRKVLIIRLDRVGDMVVTTPIFQAIKEARPHIHISVLVNPVNKNIIINNPFIDDIMLYDSGGSQKNLVSKFIFFQQLRRMKFDIVIDPCLDYELKTAIITRFIGNRYRLGFNFAGKEFFYNLRQRLPTFSYSLVNKYMTDSILDLTGFLGIRKKESQRKHPGPQIYLTREEKKRAEEILQRRGINLKNVVVGIHPGGHYESQRWAVERFAKVSDYLISSQSANVILFGSRDDEFLISRFKKCSLRMPTILPDLTLRDFMATLRLCTLFLCNNSGPLHIATAFNIPTVSTMGPTEPSLWWPYGNNHLVLRKNLECSPCNRGSCKSHECMKLITTDDFLSAVKKQLKNL